VVTVSYYALLPDGSIEPSDVSTFATRRGPDGTDLWRIDKTQVGEVEVSTVFLGLDHAWGGGTPLLFETMTFGGEDGEWQWRYRTKAAAQAGHDRVVAALRDGTPLGDLDVAS
jgi:hypothetical protein